MAAIFVSWLFVTLMGNYLVNTNSALCIEITPAKITEDSSQLVNITCLPDSQHADATSVYLLEITRNGGKPLVFLQATGISYGFGFSNTTKFQVDGVFDKDATKTFLKLTISEPSKLDEGTYTCKMLIEGGGTLKEHQASATLAIETGTDTSTLVNQLLRQMSSLEKRLDAQSITMSDMKDKNQKLTDEVSDLKDKNQKLTDKVIQDIRTLENKTRDVEKLAEKSEDIRDAKTKSVFHVYLTLKSDISDGKNKLDTFNRFLIKSDYFDEDSCVYDAPVSGNYYIGALIKQKGDGILYVYIAWGNGKWQRIIRSDKADNEGQGYAIRYVKKGEKIRMEVERKKGKAELTYAYMSGFLI